MLVTNTDDFIWRLVKGCIQLGLVPDINNTVNMVPVDHVARIVSSSAVAPISNDRMTVLHITAQPPPTYNDLFLSLGKYGFETDQCEYVVWRRRLEQHVMKTQDNALFPLLHFVLDDLPTSTKAPELNDSNTRNLLASLQQPESMTVDTSLMGLYLSWLVQAGFLSPPASSTPSEVLPSLSGRPQARAVGRSGA